MDSEEIIICHAFGLVGREWEKNSVIKIESNLYFHLELILFICFGIYNKVFWSFNNNQKNEIEFPPPALRKDEIHQRWKLIRPFATKHATEWNLTSQFCQNPRIKDELLILNVQPTNFHKSKLS